MFTIAGGIIIAVFVLAALPFLLQAAAVAIAIAIVTFLLMVCGARWPEMTVTISLAAVFVGMWLRKRKKDCDAERCALERATENEKRRLVGLPPRLGDLSAYAEYEHVTQRERLERDKAEREREAKWYVDHGQDPVSHKPFPEGHPARIAWREKCDREGRELLLRLRRERLEKHKALPTSTTHDGIDLCINRPSPQELA